MEMSYPVVTLNCGYGRGFSVLEVIETVKRVSGVDFQVELCVPRVGMGTQTFDARQLRSIAV
jgi:UDP-glucose 4-epimerase